MGHLSPEPNVHTGPIQTLRQSLFGSIRWPKSLGQPTGELAAWFTVEVWTYILSHRTPEGEVWMWIKHPQPIPYALTRDADPDYLRVDFVTHYVAGRRAVMSASFGPSAWTIPNQPGRRRRIEPTGGFLITVESADGSPKVAPPFEVLTRGNIFIQSQPQI